MSDPAPAFDARELLREASWIRALARTLADAPERADELEQETWLAALRNRPEGRGGLRPWLAAVLRNAKRASARAEEHRAARERVASRSEALPSAQELAERAEMQRSLVERVLALEEPFRSAVLLRFYEGLDSAEIARRQGTPPATVRSRIGRGVARLREELDRESGGDRKAWLAALAPLAARDSAVIKAATGVLVMKKAALVAIVLVVLGWWWLRHDAAPSEGVASASATATETSPLAKERTGASNAVDSSSSAARDALRTPAASVDGREPPSRRSDTARLRLVDERTGEPVADFRVRVNSAESSSGADGRIGLDALADPRTLELLEGGDLAPDRIQTRQDEAAAIAKSVTFELAESAESTDVAIPLGPTYRLRVAPPAGYALGDLVATLKSEDPTQAFDTATALVRDGAQPWLRFRPTARLVRGGPRWRLVLATSDGLWSGATLVESNVGIAQATAEIALQACARVDGRVVDGGGHALEGGLVRIQRDGSSWSSADNRPLFGRVNERGEFTIHCAPPGEYEVLFHREAYSDYAQRIALAPGEIRRVDIAMQKLANGDLCRIEGTVESDTHAFHDRLYVYLRPEDPALSPRNAKVDWSEHGGAWTGKFEFTEVPRGAYVIGPSGSRFLEVEPHEVRITAGEAVPALRVKDSLETATVEFRASDGEGRALSRFDVRMTLPREGGPVSFDQTKTTTGIASFEAVPVGATCEFRVSAEGKRPVWGRVTAQRDANATKVELLPGWGTEVFVTTSEGAPLEGVRVSFDGALAGETDAKGRLLAALDHEPQSASFEYRDWHPTAQGSYEPDSGRFRTWEPWLSVAMAPPQ